MRAAAGLGEYVVLYYLVFDVLDLAELDSLRTAAEKISARIDRGA